MHTEIKFNLLLQNVALKAYPKLSLQSKLIKQCLGHDLMLPEWHSTTPFIFSCFALSTDGKICYPDTLSGLDIAMANNHASTTEKQADWFYLMMARSISDAVIFSSNIFKKNSTRNKPTLAIAALKNDRITNNKPANLTPIIFCRDPSTIDFAHEMLRDENQPFLILHEHDGFDSTNFTGWNQQNISTFSNKSPKIKHLLYLDIPFTKIFNKLHSWGYLVILNESPFFHHKLLEEQILNEFWLNYSCSYIGGNALSLGNGQKSFTRTNHPDTEILALYHINYNFLYSRQLVKYAPKL